MKEMGEAQSKHDKKWSLSWKKQLNYQKVKKSIAFNRDEIGAIGLYAAHSLPLGKLRESLR
ncbi:MAG TPA: hypothetical protein VK105_10545 [Virgibacillus sp.]|nr:hypothetical protein [Virgibacillus sp.]HLR67548.1 hypothetical protein [Virgibacillus sp.]